MAKTIKQGPKRTQTARIGGVNKGDVTTGQRPAKLPNSRTLKPGTKTK